MEFVVVEFPQIRRVFIDDAPQGMTGQRQAVQEGHHVFDLGEPVDYTPARQEVLVSGTSVPNPMSIVFFPTFAATASLPDIPEVAAPKRGRARAKAKTARKPARKRPARKTKRAPAREARKVAKTRKTKAAPVRKARTSKRGRGSRKKR